MKKLIMVLAVLALVLPALAAPTIEYAGFAGDANSGWSYDATSNIFSFGKSDIGAALGGITDALVTQGAWVEVPDLLVTGSPGNWILTPNPVNNNIYIKYGADVVLMTGTLIPGTSTVTGTTAVAYSQFKIDIPSITINNVIGSAALTQIAASEKLDFNLTIQHNDEFEPMLMLATGTFQDGLSGSMTTIVPAPGALILTSLGTGLVGWLRRRKA